ncbi:MAG: lamin tail domain-containing protein [Chloroflexota bacterium]
MAPPTVLARGVLLASLLMALLAAPVVFTFNLADAVTPEQRDTASSPASLVALTGSTPEYSGAGKAARLQPAPQQQAVAGDIVISEFRFRGSGGEPDEFVELFNQTCATSINLKNWKVRISQGLLTSEVTPFPSDFLLAPGQHYLFAPPPYDSPAPAVPADADLGVGIPSVDGGIALFLPDGVTEIDEVGFDPDGYREGTPLNPLLADLDQGYRRHVTGSGTYADTSDNASDFFGPVPSEPQNTGSPLTPCSLPTPTATPTNTPTNTSTPTPTSVCNALVPSTRLVLINEVAWSGTTYNTGHEWVELYNTSTQCTVDLQDWHLRGVRSGGSLVFDLTFADGDDILPGDYFVIATAAGVFADPTISDKVPAATVQFGLIDPGMTLYLFGPDDETVDTANVGTGVVAAWPAGSTSGRRSMERYRNDADTRTNWVTFARTNLPGDWPRDGDDVPAGGNLINGSPGMANWAVSVTVTPSPIPTRARTPTPHPPTPFAHMVINEFLPRAGTDWNHDGAVNVYDEFIELKNLGPIDVDLTNWKLDDAAELGSPMFTLPGVKLQPGERAVFYGLTTRILLEDSGDTVRLINPQGIVIDARGYGVIERLDESHCRIPDGYYWRLACFATPGNENALTGVAPAPAPIVLGAPPPCLLADTVPEPFRQAECEGFGEDMWDRTYWDDEAGFDVFPAGSPRTKWKTSVE